MFENRSLIRGGQGGNALGKGLKQLDGFTCVQQPRNEGACLVDHQALGATFALQFENALGLVVEIVAGQLSLKGLELLV